MLGSKAMRNDVKFVWAKFSTLSWAVLILKEIHCDHRDLGKHIERAGGRSNTGATLLFNGVIM
jgi:hypothetical protein